MKEFFIKHFGHMISAFKYSLYGLLDGVKSETAFKQEAFGLIVLPFLAWFLDIGAARTCLALAAWLFVMGLELLNIAVESLCNLVSPEFNLLIKRAKDAGSAAVLMALFANLLLWVYFLLTP